MISPEAKTKAIALLGMGVSINEVAGELDLPLALVDEWRNNLPKRELLKAEATLAAVGMIANSEVNEDLKPQLETALLKTALEVTDKIEVALYSNDLLMMQMCKLASDSISKMFIAFSSKDAGTGLPKVQMSERTVSAFAQLMKD